MFLITLYSTIIYLLYLESKWGAFPKIKYMFPITNTCFYLNREKNWPEPHLSFFLFDLVLHTLFILIFLDSHSIIDIVIHNIQSGQLAVQIKIP